MVNGKRLRVSEYKELIRTQKQSDAGLRGAQLWFNDLAPNHSLEALHNNNNNNNINIINHGAAEQRDAIRNGTSATDHALMNIV